MAGISSAGGELKLPIGESPRSIRPDINREMQSVYNALHISNAYLTALREDIEGSDAQDPSESLRFRRTFVGIAGNALKEGDLCCSIGNRIYAGVGTAFSRSIIDVPPPYVRLNFNLTGLRSDVGERFRHVFVALSEAGAGAPVTVGVGPGVIKVPGIKCGSLVWGKSSRGSVGFGGTTNKDPLYYSVSSRPFTGDGAIYANNNRRNVTVGDISQPAEGVRLPGYPTFSGTNSTIGVAYFFPVGVCIKDDYVLISDFKEG